MIVSLILNDGSEAEVEFCCRECLSKELTANQLDMATRGQIFINSNSAPCHTDLITIIKEMCKNAL